MLKSRPFVNLVLVVFVLFDKGMLSIGISTGKSPQSLTLGTSKSLFEHDVALPRDLGNGIMASNVAGICCAIKIHD
jgi:hypothetical protein